MALDVSIVLALLRRRMDECSPVGFPSMHPFQAQIEHASDMKLDTHEPQKLVHVLVLSFGGGVLLWAHVVVIKIMVT